MNRKYYRRNRKSENRPYIIVFFLLTVSILTLIIYSFANSNKDDKPSTASESMTSENSASYDFSDDVTDVISTSIDESYTESQDQSPSTSIPEAYEYEYSIDITPYLEYIDPEMTEENKEYFLMLVNKDNVIGSDYVPPDLVMADDSLVKAGYENQIELNATALKALEALLKEAAANGFNRLRMSSGYRSYALQDWWFNYYKDQNRSSYPDESALEEYVSTFSMPAGKSEHQTGLAVDMYDTDTNATFAGTATAEWLAENAHKFGFILRYPEDKEDVTKIMYESWHFRFVGRTVATYIYENDLTLEEYLAMQ